MVTQTNSGSEILPPNSSWRRTADTFTGADKQDVRNQSTINQHTQKVSNEMGVYGGVGTFSGIDYKAIIYLPIDTNIVTKQIEAYQKEIDRLNNLQKEYSAVLSRFNEIYNSGNTDTERREARHWLAQMQSRFGLSPTGNSDSLVKRIDSYITEQNALHILIETGKPTDVKTPESVMVAPVWLGNLQTITISSHREKFPVRTLGRSQPKSYTRGGRTIAGSMIFTVFNEHVFADMLRLYNKYKNTGVRSNDTSYAEYGAVLPDQLPPFDITILAANEIGDRSFAALYGVELMNEGIVMSIQDIITESTFQYMARDYQPLTPMDNGRLNLNSDTPIQTASDLMKKYYKEQNQKKEQQKRLSTFR